MPPRIKALPFKVLSKYFHMPIRQVMSHLNVSAPTLKKMCRHYNIERWPYRKLQSIDRSLSRISSDPPMSIDADKAQAKMNKLIMKRNAILQGEGLSAPSSALISSLALSPNSFEDDSQSSECDSDSQKKASLCGDGSGQMNGQMLPRLPSILPIIATPHFGNTLQYPPTSSQYSSSPYPSSSQSYGLAQTIQEDSKERECLLALSTLGTVNGTPATPFDRVPKALKTNYFNFDFALSPSNHVVMPTPNSSVLEGLPPHTGYVLPPLPSSTGRDDYKISPYAMPSYPPQTYSNDLLRYHNYSSKNVAAR